jgi:dephospho-CoA kinase
MMHVWAITGGIACGKSTVSSLFASYGAQIRSADEDARLVVQSGSPTLAAVLAEFPEAADQNQTLDRAILARIIFSDPSARQRLNAIMHPAIRQQMRAAIDTARASMSNALLLYEVPLLYEGGLDVWFDGVIAVICSEGTQLKRLIARGLTEDAAKSRIASQLDPLEKARRANYVIRTDVDPETTQKEIAQIFAAIMVDSVA